MIEKIYVFVTVSNYGDFKTFRVRTRSVLSFEEDILT
jgi:hypothetical protein